MILTGTMNLPYKDTDVSMSLTVDIVNNPDHPYDFKIQCQDTGNMFSDEDVKKMMQLPEFSDASNKILDQLDSFHGGIVKMMENMGIGISIQTV